MKSGITLCLMTLILGSFLLPEIAHADAISDSVGTGEISVASSNSQSVISQAEAFMADGKPAEAYNLLQQQEFEFSGEKRFDYLLGIAALDSGKPDKATLALERVMAMDPNFAGARLDMARAYFQLGDLVRAKTEFDTVLKQNPPKEARDTIQKYLDAIQAREDSRKTQISAYFEETLGHDGNVNSATSQAQIPVPAFGNLVFTLDQANLKSSDNYNAISVGAEINHAVKENYGIYAGTDLKLRNYINLRNFNSTSLAIHAGGYYNYAKEVFRLGVTAEDYLLGSSNKPNRVTTGALLEWRHPASQSDQLTLFGQYARNRFVASGMEIQNFNMILLGESWLHVRADGKSVIFGSLFGSNENATAPVTLSNPAGGRPDGNKLTTGVRIGSQTSVNENWDYFNGIGFQKVKYEKQNAAFMTKRNDSTWDFNAGATWHDSKNWSVRPQITYSRTNSNITIYSFDRTDFSVMVRRDFN
jgi:tetratricopeptide (TPR) repeat protein